MIVCWFVLKCTSILTTSMSPKQQFIWMFCIVALGLLQGGNIVNFIIQVTNQTRTKK